jgi:hypothetical protein
MTMSDERDTTIKGWAIGFFLHRGDVASLEELLRLVYAEGQRNAVETMTAAVVPLKRRAAPPKRASSPAICGACSSCSLAHQDPCDCACHRSWVVSAVSPTPSAATPVSTSTSALQVCSCVCLNDAVGITTIDQLNERGRVLVTGAESFVGRLVEDCRSALLACAQCHGTGKL